MAYDHVARPLGDGTYRIGNLTLSDDGTSVVAWSDGGEQRFESMPVSFIPFETGTLRHLAFSDPETFRAQCANEPGSVLTRAVRDAGKPVSRGDIVMALRSIGLTDQEISALWKIGQKALAKDRHVRTDGKPPRYSWSDEPIDEYAALRGYPPAAALGQLIKAKDDAAREALIEAVQRRTEDQVLVAALAAVLDAGDPPTETAIAAAIRTPLATATSEPDLSEAVLAAGAPRLGDSARWLIAAWPKASRAADALDFVTDQQTARRQLARAGDELASVSPKDSLDYLSAVERLIDRSRPDEPDLERLTHVLRIAESAARYGTRASEIVETCLREWMAAAPGPAGASLERVGVDGFRRALALLPFAPHSQRPLAMVRLANVIPDDAADQRWWTDVTTDDLFGVADHTEVRRLLLSDRVRDAIVRPKLAQEVNSTRDPRKLFSLLSGHPELVRLLDPPTVSSALTRIGETNQFVADLLSPLRKSGQVAELLGQLRERQDQVDRLAGELKGAEDYSLQLREKIGRLEARLRSNAQAASSLTEADLQLASMESRRRLADALVEIEFLSQAQVGPEVFSERLEAIAASAGLTPIGQSGGEVSFDPRLHDALGAPVLPGDRLSVARLGYSFGQGPDAVVLLKAQVVEGSHDYTPSQHRPGA